MQPHHRVERTLEQSQEVLGLVLNAVGAGLALPLVAGLDARDIHNRWGDVIFSSDQIGFGWNGMHMGVPAPEGSYGYFISIRDGAGRIYETTGLVHLLVGE